MRTIMMGTLAWVLLGMAMSGAAAAAVLRVDAAATGASPDGTTWAAAFPTLQAALASSSDDDEIWVAEGTYTPGDAGANRSASFVLDKSVAVYGGFVSGATAIDQRDAVLHKTVLSGDLARNDDVDTNWLDNSYHVVQLTDASVSATLDGVAVSNSNADGGEVFGYPDDSGGGVFLSLGTLTMRNCVVTANSVMGGGAGVYSREANLTLEGCRLELNRGSQGGGVMVYGGVMHALRCLFLQNNAASAGGAYVTIGGQATFANCVFADNVHWLGGGGIYNDSLTAMTVLNCTFSGNNGSSPGGAIVNWMTPATVENSILWGNVPDEISNEQDSVCTVSHSIVAGGYDGDGNSGADPLFRLPKTPWPYQLSCGSPAIDAASSNAPATDIEGNARPQNAGPDIGAYEFGADTDDGGLPDAYESAHGLNPADPADDSSDSDNDGLSNREEFRRGTDPQDDADPATEYYVSSAGSDETGNGSEATPWATIAYAMSAVPEATPSFTVKIHLAAGTYNEKIVFRPYTWIIGAGSDATTIEHFEDWEDTHVVIIAAEGCSLEDCTVTFPEAVTATAELLRIQDVSMRIERVVFDGRDSPHATGVFVTWPGSSSSSIRNSVVKRLEYGVYAVDSGITITRTRFEEFLGGAVFIHPPEGKDGAAETPMLGDTGNAASTGFNQFRSTTGFLVKNMTTSETSAQYNDWGAYTASDIGARVSSGTGSVGFGPYVGQSLIDASLVVIVQNQATGEGLPDTNVPKAAIGTLAPPRDTASGLFIFATLAAGAHGVTVTANGFVSQTRTVNAVPGDIAVAVFSLQSDGTTPGDGGCFRAASGFTTAGGSRGDGLIRAGVLLTLLMAGRRHAARSRAAG